MLDIAMIAMGLVMFVLLLGYAPLCDKLMWSELRHAVRLHPGRRRVARHSRLSDHRARAPREIL